MFYGWVVNPVEYIDIAPESPRVDYKTDYVLMTAEAYNVNLRPGHRRPPPGSAWRPARR